MLTSLFAAAIVNASSFGFNPTNATAALQKALDSGARTVVVDRQTSDWIVDPLHVRSNTTVVFADGVTVRARKGGFKGRNDILFSAHCVKNVGFIGKGRAVIAMNADDYRDPERYQSSEFRHAISLEQVKGAKVSNLVIQGSGGDGIFVDTVHDGLIERVISEDNVRQGISVVSCRRLTIRDCVFATTKGKPPQSGVDFEPDGARDEITDVLVENCVFAGNAGWGIDFHLDALNHNSAPVSARLVNCRVWGNTGAGVRFDSAGWFPLRGRVTFEGCEVSGNAGPAFLLRRQTAGALKLELKDCVIDGRGSTSDVVRVHNGAHYRPFGGVSLENVTVIADSGCKAFEFRARPGAGAKDIEGGITVVRGAERKFHPAADFVSANPPSPEHSPFTVPVKPAKEYNFRPVNPSAKGKTGVSSYYWFAGTFLQYVPGPGEYPIFFRKSLAGAGRVPVVRVRVEDPSGKTVDSFSTRGFDDYTYNLKATGKGVYKFMFTSYEYAVAIDSVFPGQGMLADVAARCWKTRKSLDHDHVYHFRVNAGTKAVHVGFGPHCSSVIAELIDADGNVVGRGEGAGDKGQFVLKAVRRDSGKAETWSVRLRKIGPRCDIMLGAGCTPVICSDREMILEEF